MKIKIVISAFVLFIVLFATVAAASTFGYLYGGINYTASLNGGGIINPSLSFNLTNGYIVPNDPSSTYSVYGTVVNFNSQPSQAWEQGSGGTISVMYDTNPYILTGNASVFKAWYQAGSSPQQMGYMESSDGVIWYKYYGNPLSGTSGYTEGSVVKYNGIYYMFCNLVSSLHGIYLLQSSNGVTGWASAGQILSDTSTWDAYQMIAQVAWLDSDGIWKMLASGCTSGGVWSVGLWTSSSPAGTWTAYSGNPVITKSPGLVYLPSQPYKDSLGYYWTWLSASDAPSTNAAVTDSMRYRTVNPDNLTAWSANPNGYINVGPSRVSNSTTAQRQGRTPQTYIRVGNLTYEFYTYGVGDQALNTGYMGLMITPLRIDQIVPTNEQYPNLTYQG